MHTHPTFRKQPFQGPTAASCIVQIRYLTFNRVPAFNLASGTSATFGTVVSWNSTANGNGTTDFLNSGQLGGGGFTFSSQTTTASTQILGVLNRGTFAAQDSSLQLATTQWVQSAISAATVPVAAVTTVTYYANMAASSTSAILTNLLITINNLSTQNFYGTTFNAFFAVRYTYTSFSGDLSTVVSSTGELFFFPSRISGAVYPTGQNHYFGTGANTSSYNINNSINAVTAFNAGFNSYTPWNRQFWVTAPAQGQSSGYVGAPTTIFLNGSDIGQTTTSTASYGFNLLPPLVGQAWNYSITLELMVNPYSSTCPVTFLPSYSNN